MPELSIHTNDNALLASFKDEQSREAVFTVIVKKYQERLYWHIRRMVVAHEDTNDILQGVFIKMWHNLGDFRGESALYTWLYRIATNETLTWLDREKKRRNRSADYNETMMSGRIADQSGYDAQKIEWKLQQAMHALPDKQRIVFSLRYYDEMPYDEMSRVLGTSEGALKASYHHAVKKVEEYLKTH